MFPLSSNAKEIAEADLPIMRSGGWIHLGTWVNSMSRRMGFLLRSPEMESIDLGAPKESVTGTLCTITLAQGVSLEASADACPGASTVLMMVLMEFSCSGGMSLVKVIM